MSGGHNGKNVLVLLLDEDPDLAPVRRELAGREGMTVRLVAPAHVGPLHWFATDEDAAHDEATARAEESERAIATVGETEASAGDADPVLAVEDTLSDFAADRILVVGEADAALASSLERFDIPIERLDAPPPDPGPGDDLRETGRAVMSGRSDATPYVVFGGTMLVLLSLVTLGLLLAALMLWVF